MLGHKKLLQAFARREMFAKSFMNLAVFTFRESIFCLHLFKFLHGRFWSPAQVGWMVDSRLTELRGERLKTQPEWSGAGILQINLLLPELIHALLQVQARLDVVLDGKIVQTSLPYCFTSSTCGWKIMQRPYPRHAPAIGLCSAAAASAFSVSHCCETIFL